jgi:hypothetical protein
MEDAHPLAAGALIIKPDRWRLIEVLQYRSVMFHFMDARQLNLMALKLNGDAHLFAGVSTSHIGAATTHTT